MKILLIIPLVLAAVALAGVGVCASAGWALDTHAMGAALSAVFVGTMLAIAPAALMRHSPVGTITQAALAGTVIQLFLVMMLAGLVWVGQLSGSTNAFLWWLLAFYWSSLATLVVWSVRLVRQVSKDAKKPGTDGPGSQGPGVAPAVML